MRKPPELLLGERIALDDHIADDVVLTTGNGVLAMFEVGGVFPDTADQVDVEAWFSRLHNALKNIAADDVELTVYQCRGEAEPAAYEPGLHTAAFARDLEAAYRDNLLSGLLYSNRLFLAVQVHAPSAAVQSLVRFLSDAGSNPRAGIYERQNRLNEICDVLRGQLVPFGLRRLGYVKRGGIIFDEIAEAIIFALTGIWRQIGATTGRMGNAMFSEALRFRRKDVEIDGPGAPSYAALFAFKEYPATTWPGMFAGLAVAPYRCTLAQSFRFLSNADGSTALSRKQNRMLVAGDKALSQSEELTRAADELLSRKWVLGSQPGADRVCRWQAGNGGSRQCRLARSRGVRSGRDPHQSCDPRGVSILSSRGRELAARPGFVKSSNFVAFAPLYSWPSGSARGHWPGPPIAIFRTLAGTPYRFHWQVGDVGNTLVPA